MHTKNASPLLKFANQKPHPLKTAHHQKSKISLTWFTLVELIVVITILVILGTIAFVSLGGFSGNARDGSRVSDLTNLSKGLDVYMVRNGSFPTPSIPVGDAGLTTVSYSGNLVFSQGTIGGSVINALSSVGAKMSKKPTDPLNTSQEYTYSIAVVSREYQIMTNWEWDVVAHADNLENNPFVDTVSAATGNPTITYIKGNYNGVLARAGTSPIYFLALPSLITSATGTLTNTGIVNKLFVQGNTNSWGITYDTSMGVFMVYSASSLPKSDSDHITLATGIATAYSGTSLAGNTAIQPFIAALTSNNTVALASLGGGLVMRTAGGGGNIGSALVNGVCTWLPANATYYSGVTTYSLVNALAGTSLVAIGVTTPVANTCQFSCWGGSILNGSSCVFRGATASDTSGWSVKNTACPTCAYGSTKNLGVMSLLSCEVEAAKNNATMFYPDTYQHPSTGTNMWRWRISAAYGVYSPQHSTHYETSSAAGSISCGLFRGTGNITSTDGSYSAALISVASPWATGVANGYTYRIYRYSTSNSYNCSLWLRVNGLNIYWKWPQSMLSWVTATHNNGIDSLCTHGNCGSTYGYLSSTTQTNAAGDNSPVLADGFCYGSTIY